MEVTINVAEENRNDGTMEGNNKYADFFNACEAEYLLWPYIHELRCVNWSREFYGLWD